MASSYIVSASWSHLQAVTWKGFIYSWQRLKIVLIKVYVGIIYTYIYLLTYSMEQSPSWEANWLQPVKKFPAFYGTRKFITALTSARHLPLSWASPIQSTHPHRTSRRSVVILSSLLRLGLPSGLLPSGFPTKTLYVPLLSTIRATCPAHLILLDFITRTRTRIYIKVIW
jgi:hypothetical protein